MRFFSLLDSETNAHIKATIQPIPVHPTSILTKNIPHFLEESLNNEIDVGIKKILIKHIIAKINLTPNSLVINGCPARIRTWVEGVKVLCATTTPPGKVTRLLSIKH